MPCFVVDFWLDYWSVSNCHMAPSSTSSATLKFVDLGSKLPPASPDIGIVTTLRKDYKDLAFALKFTDATLRDPQSLRGVTITAEMSLGGRKSDTSPIFQRSGSSTHNLSLPFWRHTYRLKNDGLLFVSLAEGVRGSICYDAGTKNTIGSVTLDKQVNNSDLQLKAVYKQQGEVFILEESWRFDAKNKLSGAYNFATEEATFAYSYTHDAYTATTKYNFQSDQATLEVAKRQGKNLYTASYCPQTEAASLTWAAKPYRVRWFVFWVALSNQKVSQLNALRHFSASQLIILPSHVTCRRLLEPRLARVVSRPQLWSLHSTTTLCCDSLIRLTKLTSTDCTLRVDCCYFLQAQYANLLQPFPILIPSLYQL